ncbi:unnamed protein product [Ilex paraguariensis]|uniref:Uncharacterized protein n=1 Tax=Ilex paraguariensis TaxID=185542 RepID=A0ABC8T0W9_9AQUA
MGNCSVKGVAVAQCPKTVRIMTDSGGILQLEGPKLVGEVLNDFPGYRIFRQGRMSSPLFAHEQLFSGQVYYLLPIVKEKLTLATEDSRELSVEDMNESAPVRMSSSVALDLVTNVVAKGSAIEVLPPPRKGVWSVKLVINTEQLEEILAEQVNIEALIEQMRMAASSASGTPKRMRSFWGVSNWKPILTNIFLKVPSDCQNKVIH